VGCTIDNAFNLRDIILTNSRNTRSRRLKALSIVHPTNSKVSLKMALQLGRNM